MAVSERWTVAWNRLVCRLAGHEYTQPKMYGVLCRRCQVYKEWEPWEGVKSPFDKDVIQASDPVYALLDKALETGKPLEGEYDPRTGEILSARVVGEEEEKHA
jgi:hypothetical protein